MTSAPVAAAGTSAAFGRTAQRHHDWMVARVILFALGWCIITASWPGREYRAADELYEGGFDLAIKFQVVAWALVGIGSVVALKARLAAAVRMIIGSSLRWYALFAVGALCSTAWSVSPVLTAFRALQLCTTLLLVVLIVKTTEANRIYTFYFCYGCVAIMALGAGACWILVPGETERAFGPPLFRGTLAIVAAICAVATIPRALSSAQRRPGQWAIVLLLLTGVVLAGRSRGVVIAFTLVGLLGMLLSFRGRLTAVFIATAVTCAAFAYSQPLWDYFNRADVGGGDIRTLNGRLPIWDEIISMRHDLPWLGRGFVAGSRDWFVEEFMARGGGFAAQHAHNAWLNALIETGLPGLFCLIMLTWVLVRDGGRIMVRALAHEPQSSLSSLKVGFALAALYTLVIGIPWHGLAARAGPTLLPMLLCCYWVRPARRSPAQTAPADRHAPETANNPRREADPDCGR
ncbi:MAG: O-antigen ligase family protein [Verrucomicrobia bacterium]|nr:O-antigen ligase family protein [Verrucomicrobiota bacterium]